jgi:hypothetical protein
MSKDTEMTINETIDPAVFPDGQPVTPEAMAERMGAPGAHFRQGDVLIKRSTIPADAKPVPRDNGSVVLAYGEATGHSHQLRGPNVTMFRDSAGHEYVRVTAPEPLAHEEHSAIPTPVIEGESGAQVEFEPAALRNVAD